MNIFYITTQIFLFFSLIPWVFLKYLYLVSFSAEFSDFKGQIANILGLETGNYSTQL